MKSSRVFILLSIVQVFIIIGESFLTFELLKEPPQASVSASSEVALALFESISTNIQALTEQPLFQPTRRPYVPSSEPMTSVEAHLLTTPVNPPTLTGIILVPHKPFALLENIQQKTAKFIGPGDSFDGWTIKSINRKTVVLSKQNQDDIVLTLDPEQLSPLFINSN